MTKLKKMLHLSTIGIWDIAENKGRVSTLYPLKAFVNKGYYIHFLTTSNVKISEYTEGIRLKHVKILFPILKRRHFELFTHLLRLPILSVYFFLVGLMDCLQEKPVVIYAHGPYVTLSAFLLSKLFNVKYIVRLYGVGNVYRRSYLYKIARIDLHLTFLLRADKYILTNDGTSADKVAAYYRIPKEKIYFMKNGIFKKWANQDTDRTLKAHLAPESQKIVLSVSRLIKSKQVDLLIKAVPGIIKVSENVRFVIVGDGSERNSLESLVKLMQIANYVKFVGAVDNSAIIDYMKVSDIFVSMNSLSNVCNPVLEAMICGKCVVALNTGNTEELIKNGETGILINPENVSNLSASIVSILSNNNKRHRIGRNAQKHLLNKWPSWEERVACEVAIVERMLNMTAQ